MCYQEEHKGYVANKTGLVNGGQAMGGLECQDKQFQFNPAGSFIQKNFEESKRSNQIHRLSLKRNKIQLAKTKSCSVTLIYYLFIFFFTKVAYCRPLSLYVQKGTFLYICRICFLHYFLWKLFSPRSEAQTFCSSIPLPEVTPKTPGKSPREKARQGW